LVHAIDALKRLREGNHRFVSNSRSVEQLSSQARRNELVDDQKPFATILGCSDSRVPPEIIFDQGLGDLFVIRVAGNIVTQTHIGSIEFAAEQFGTRLVVVLGHTQCGAVQAALADLAQSTESQSPNLGAIVDHIRPAVAELMETEVREDFDALMRHAVRANMHASVKQLQHGSEMLAGMISESGLIVVGAEYSLETGKVKFFEDLTETG
jgi:carbonic anhydrase